MIHRVLVLLLVLGPVASAEGARPAARGSSPLAASIDTVRQDGGEYAGALYYRSLPEDQRRKLDADGQVLLGEPTQTGSYAGFIKAVAIFKQPKKRTWELITDTSKLASILPRLRTSVAIQKTPGGELSEFAVRVLLSTYTFHVQHWFYPDQSRFEWTLDPTYKNDIKSQDGYWQLFELDDHTTIGEYGTRVDTGLMVPGFLQQIFTRGDIPKAMRAMRAYVDSNGTWHKDG